MSSRVKVYEVTWLFIAPPLEIFFETKEPKDWVRDCIIGESKLVPIFFPEVFPVLLFVDGVGIFSLRIVFY